MVGNPLKPLAGGNYRVLRMPNHRQPQGSKECVQYALWTVCEYAANEYPDRSVRDAIDPPKLDTIANYIEVGTGGWRPNQESLNELSAVVGGLDFSLDSQYNSPTGSVIEYVQPSLQNLLPSVLWIDELRMKRGNRTGGALHAVVVSGHSDDRVTYYDPLLGDEKSVAAERLNDAWDPEMSTAIDVTLSSGIAPTTVEEQ